MKAKTGKVLREEINYDRIEKQRKEMAGEDCFTVIYGNEVIGIGYQQQYPSCIDFIIKALVDDLDSFIERCGFDDAEDCYSYLFAYCDNEQELKSFLEDYFSGAEMINYGKE